MKKRKLRIYFDEHYTVKYTCPNAERVWSTAEEDVAIRIPHGDPSEKNNHEEAAKLVLAKHPGCRIINVKYQ